MKEFLKRKNVELSFEVYFIRAMSAMAMGLFSTLIIGVVLETVGTQLDIPFLVSPIGETAKSLGGVGIAIAVAMSLKAPNLVVYSSAINGMIGSALGGPVGAFIGAVVGAEVGKLVAGETSIDVILTPLVTIMAGSTVGYLVGPPIDNVMVSIGQLIIHATELQPLVMGIVVAVIMAILLVLPTSSTAIVIMIGVTGAASGAIAVGCCAVCVGFAVQSYPENGVKGLWAQIPGSPMIQVGNIFRNPLTLIPPCVAAAVVGALSTTVMPVMSVVSASGTGTSGFVTPIGIYAQMTEMGEPIFTILIRIAVLCFILPAIITFVVSKLMRKNNLIKFGDLKLEL